MFRCMYFIRNDSLPFSRPQNVNGLLIVSAAKHTPMHFRQFPFFRLPASVRSGSAKCAVRPVTSSRGENRLVSRNFDCSGTLFGLDEPRSEKTTVFRERDGTVAPAVLAYQTFSVDAHVEAAVAASSTVLHLGRKLHHYEGGVVPFSPVLLLPSPAGQGARFVAVVMRGPFERPVVVGDVVKCRALLLSEINRLRTWLQQIRRSG